MIHFFKSIFTPPSSPFLTGFERFKPQLVHFLGGYILSSEETPRRGGRQQPHQYFTFREYVERRQIE
jgi:hypothetical protein